jgi:hypothetical protein
MSIENELNEVTRRLLENVAHGTMAELYGANSFLRILQENAMSGAEGTAAPAVMAAVAGELRPPPEHADKTYHWLLDIPTNTPEPWEWCDGSWLAHGDARAMSAAETSEYRYLGPAEWRDESEGRAMAGHRVWWPDELGPPLFDGEPGQRVLHETTRIAELEAENRKLRDYAEMHRAGHTLAQWPLLTGNSGPVVVAFDPCTGGPVDDPKPATFNVPATHDDAPIDSRYVTPIALPAQISDDPAPTNPTDAIHQEVERVIGHIAGGKVNQPARKALRGALDKAEAPPQGRAASDAAIGRIAKMESAAPLPMGVWR